MTSERFVTVWLLQRHQSAWAPETVGVYRTRAAAEAAGHKQFPDHDECCWFVREVPIGGDTNV